MKKLDARERRFVGEYLIDLDPKRAALEAGYSKTMAASKAYQWVSNCKVKPHVFAAIQKAEDRRAQRTEITQDRVLFELASLGFSNMQDFLEKGEDGKDVLKQVSALHSQHAAAISELTVDKDGKTKLKLADKRPALVDIGKHLGMFPSRHEHTGKDGGPIEMTDEVSDLEKARRIAFILNRAAECALPDNTEET